MSGSEKKLRPAPRAKKAARKSTPTVLTIGHSTHTPEEFVRMLQAHAVTRVVDVRTVPRSRHIPQFNRDTLPVGLKAAGIGYTHLPELGGLRRTTPESVNGGWRNASFRGYADYMQTPEFQTAVERLIEMAREDRLALMCAEAVPWRCHRSLIEDALWVRKIPSEDIMSATLRRPHTLTSFAKVKGTQITYPPVVSPNPDTPAKARPARARTKRLSKSLPATSATKRRKTSAP
jgi:uncharacterized protein (DUF488 family)